jgi:hypothetical protein
MFKIDTKTILVRKGTAELTSNSTIPVFNNHYD